MSKTWVRDIRTFASPHPDKQDLKLLSEALSGMRRIGLPLGEETNLRMPLLDFEELKERLRKANFLDATKLVQNIRQIKSEREIEKLKDICQITSKAFEQAPNLFCENQTLKDVFRTFRIALLKGGADDVPYLVGATGRDGYHDVISPPTDQQLKRGEVLMLDTGATKDGYFSDFNRNFTIGKASSIVQKGHEALIRATRQALKVAVPGATCRDLFIAMIGELGDERADIGRLGHGLGIQLTETPSITNFDTTVLKERMVLTIEPSIKLPNGKILAHEENIVIRTTQPELLSTASQLEIPTI